MPTQRVVDKILKQLTPQRIEKEIEAVQKVKLPKELLKWIEEYEKVGKRDRFIWKWLYEMNENAPFLEIFTKHKKTLHTTKTLFNMFIILLDDVAEEKRERLLAALLKVPFEGKHIKSQSFSWKNKKYLSFTRRVWYSIKKTIKAFPRFEEYEAIFEYDTRQFLNEVRYTHIIFLKPALMNELEYWMYLPQGMQIIIDFDLDLMCSVEQVDTKELGLIREGVLILQRMGRVGNWISTWEREVEQSDFTAGVFPYALMHKSFSVHDLLNEKKEKIIYNIKHLKAEEYLLKEWEKDYQEIKRRSQKIKSVNFNEILKKFEELLFMHLISRGLK